MNWQSFLGNVDQSSSLPWTLDPWQGKFCHVWKSQQSELQANSPWGSHTQEKYTIVLGWIIFLEPWSCTFQKALGVPLFVSLRCSASCCKKLNKASSSSFLRTAYLHVPCGHLELDSNSSYNCFSGRHTSWLARSQVPDQGFNTCPLQWKPRIIICKPTINV